jgi:hypothetical protein
MLGSDEDYGRSRRPSVEDREWSSTGRVLGGRTIKRLGDAMCGLHSAQGDEKHRFLGWPQNQGRPFLPVSPQTNGFGIPDLGLKTGSYGLVI